MTMNYNQLFTQLNTEPSPEIRNDIVSFLKHCNIELKHHQDHATEVAYAIAGLMATDFVRTLPGSDPINTILTIAGELEVKPDNEDMLRNELITSIDRLQ